MTTKKINELPVSTLTEQDAMSAYIPISGIEADGDDLQRVDLETFKRIIHETRTVVPHTYWRIYFDANNSTSSCGVSELQFFEAGSGTNAVTEYANVVVASGGTGSLAFDGNPSTSWTVAGTSGVWIGYRFSQAVGIVRVRITAATITDQSPKDFRVQYSDNGTTWTDAWTVTGQTGWIAGESRHFTNPSPTWVTVPTYGDENAVDAVAAALGSGGAGVTVTYNDGANTITVAADPEFVRDTIATALVAGAGVTITPNDGADTITISSSVTQYTDEMARDAIGSALVAGAGVTITVNDGADTITISSTGGGGGGSLPAGGTTGQVLAKASNTDGDATWIDAPTGGSSSTGGDYLPNYAPPLPTDFPVTVAAAGSTITLTNSTSGMGFKITSASASGVHNTFAGRAAASPFSMVGRVQFLGKYGNPFQVGFSFYNSGNGRFVSIGKGRVGSANPVIEVNRWGSTTAFASNQANYGGTSEISDNPFYKLVNDGTNLTFSISSNGTDWTTVYTETVAAYLGAVTHVGLFSDLESTNEITGFVDWYEDTNLPARKVAVGGANYPSFTGNAGKVLAVNSAATNVEWVAIGGGGWKATATGTGAAQNISIPSGLAANNVLVFVNGIRYSTTEFTISGTTLTLTTNASGDAIEIIYAGGSGGGTLPSLQPHKYWRVFVWSNNGSSAVAIGEMEMRATPGGADQCVGGTASASSELSGSFVASYAFNDNGGTSFWVAATGTGEWLAYQFTSPVVVQEITLTSRSDGYTTDAPKAFCVQWSDDGVKWQFGWGPIHSSGWTAGATRTFTTPDIGYTGGGAQDVRTVNNQTSDYTLQLSDSTAYIRLNKATAANITVPANATVAFPVGTEIPVTQKGAGQVTFVAASGVTINTSETLKLRRQNSTALLIKVAADEWDLTGDMQPTNVTKSIPDFSAGVPALSAFTQLNFSTGATAGEVAGKSIYMTSSAGNTNTLGLAKAVPGSTYSVVFHMATHNFTPGNAAQWGWRDSVTGKCILFQKSSATRLLIMGLSNLTTWNNTIVDDTSFYLPNEFFVRMRDDGSISYCDISLDAVTWSQIYQVTKSSGYLGSSGYNQILLVCGDGSSTYGSGFTCRLYDESGAARTY